ncbi:TlpA family protein disulfide reductase [Roseibium salinum]|uniref:TlpA disulfide reductase family protein n=1 Tax=Roseibium salinum TaxID=1604349 RepID=A0ABT3QVP9_9HYPH|nr:TlpA disulfide reductase family protein [Roseibium sp. DSM 29163]MCX2720982.1 TlpA disulfide reductase family protein [Roseibium sp. DSM 29163]MDN3722440.1 TlpA disulfide reductase family protein [Roseibium salinum]
MTGLFNRRRAILVALAAGVPVLVALAAASVIYVRGAEPSGGSIGDRPKAAAASSRSFVVHEAPRSLPDITFADGSGQSLTLADFDGKMVLLNIWATWCLPCRTEMPALEALEAQLGDAGFQVVPLSVDRAGPGAIRKFYSDIGIRQLGLYIDASMQSSFDLAAPGLPTTLLIDAQGREVGRLIGPAEWDAPEMIAFLKTHLIPN